MEQNPFNLLDESWLKVSDKDGHIDTVSLIDLFKHAQDYRQLAGEMPAQDLAILRFLLAILLTVYSRYDANGYLYDWVDLNEDTMEPIIGDDDEREDLLDDYADNQETLYQTWATLYEKKQFSDVVIKYLEKHRNRFNLFDDKYPFCQVPPELFNKTVKPAKQIKPGKTVGEVVIKLLNRTISESGNSIAPFSPRATIAKNDMEYDELVRWMITYQNFSGASDKTQADYANKSKHKYSTGWLFTIHPVYIEGDTLFDTLMLNLTLTTNNHTSLIECPVWEKDPADYLDDRIAELMPDNLAELYTLWSRLLYLRRDEKGPTLFAAKLPLPDSTNSFLEPMTVWQLGRKEKNYFAPRIKENDLQRSMWTNFGEYVPTSGDDRAPGVVSWVKALQKNNILSRQKPIDLITTGFLKDNTPSSQMPIYELYDQLKLPADVIFDSRMKQSWPKRIGDAVQATNWAISIYSSLAHIVGGFQGYNKNTGLDKFANKLVKQVYTQLNIPFTNWLSSLKADDDRDQKVQEWYRTTRRILYQACQDALTTASSEQFHKTLKPNKYLTANARTKMFGEEPRALFEVVYYYWHVITLALPVANSRKEDAKTDESNK